MSFSVWLLFPALALLFAACGNDQESAGDILQRTHGYEPGRAALVFVYTDG